MYIDEYRCICPSGCFYSCICPMMLCGTGYVLWIELPVQRRLCPIFMSSVRLPDIHEYSCDAPKPGVSVDYQSTYGKSIRLVSRDTYLSKNGHLGPCINTHQTCTQLYSNSPGVILLLLLQIHIKIYNSNTYYPKTSKPQPDFLQNRSLK